MSEIGQKQESASIQRSGFSGMSITAFILSLFGFLLALPAVAGLVLGIVSLARSSSDFRRRGLAIAAVVVSSLWILIFGMAWLIGGSVSEGEGINEASIEERMDKARDTTNGPAPSPSRIVVEGLTAEQAQVICPFVQDFAKPGSDKSISVSVAGRSQIERMSDAIAVGTVAEALQSDLQETPLLGDWFTVALALQSPEYQAGQFISNDAGASASLANLNNYCRFTLQGS